MFFNPDPYVKLNIIPHGAHHQQQNGSQAPLDTSHSPTLNVHMYTREYKTSVASNTCFPVWRNEKFVIVARESDKITFEVKDKFAKTKPSINRFLGRLSLEISSLASRARNNNG